MQLDTKRISDHAMVFLNICPRDAKPRSSQPIEPTIFKHEQLPQFLDAVMKDRPVEHLDATARLLQHKSNIRIAARHTREWLQDHEEAAPFNGVKNLSAIARCIWRQDFNAACKLRDTSTYGAKFIRTDNSTRQVFTEDPVDFELTISASQRVYYEQAISK